MLRARVYPVLLRVLSLSWYGIPAYFSSTCFIFRACAEGGWGWRRFFPGRWNLTWPSTHSRHLVNALWLELDKEGIVQSCLVCPFHQIRLYVQRPYPQTARWNGAHGQSSLLWSISKWVRKWWEMSHMLHSQPLDFWTIVMSSFRIGSFSLCLLVCLGVGRGKGSWRVIIESKNKSNLFVTRSVLIPLPTDLDNTVMSSL